MKKAAAIMATAGALMASVPDVEHYSGRKKYPSAGGSTNHGKYSRPEYKRRKAAKRAENKARNKQH